jgi:hypothetical protein
VSENKKHASTSRIKVFDGEWSSDENEFTYKGDKGDKGSVAAAFLTYVDFCEVFAVFIQYFSKWRVERENTRQYDGSTAEKNCECDLVLVKEKFFPKG